MKLETLTVSYVYINNNVGAAEAVLLGSFVESKRTRAIQWGVKVDDLFSQKHQITTSKLLRNQDTCKINEHF